MFHFIKFIAPELELAQQVIEQINPLDDDASLFFGVERLGLNDAASQQLITEYNLNNGVLPIYFFGTVDNTVTPIVNKLFETRTGLQTTQQLKDIIESIPLDTNGAPNGGAIVSFGNEGGGGLGLGFEIPAWLWGAAAVASTYKAFDSNTTVGQIGFGGVAAYSTTKYFQSVKK